MRRSSVLTSLAVMILFILVVAPVQAESAEELARGASLDFLGVDLIDPQPAYQKSAQDYIKLGNYYQDGCQKLNTRFNDQVFSWAKSRAEYLETVDAVMIYKNPSRQVQLMTLNDPQFQKDNPGSFSEYTKMVAWCNAARDNYNMALSMTAPDDFEQQATIYDSAAVVYDTVGNTSAAEDARDEAAFARGREHLKSGSDCLIVTAAFGSPLATEVQLVRDFRDDTIKHDYLGSRYVTALNAMYYSFSPAVARAIDDNPSTKPAIRLLLRPLIGIVLLSQGVYQVLSFSPEIATIAFIIVGGALVGCIYIMPVMFAVLLAAGRKRLYIPPLSGLRSVLAVWAGLLAILAFGAVMRIDFVAILCSGLLFACTVLLSAAVVSLFLYRHLGSVSEGQNG